MPAGRFYCLATAALVLVAATPAAARPAPEEVWAEDGTTVQASWSSCEPKTFSYPSAAGGGATATPAVGETFADSQLEVRSVAVQDGVASWSVAPNAEGCSALTSGAATSLELDDVLRVGFPATRLVIDAIEVARETNGVTSIAGFNTSFGSGAYPTYRRARAHFGRPSKLRRTRAGCTAAWQRIGLQLELTNYGGGDRCKFVQSARITKPSLWAVSVGDRPAIVETSQPDYLVQRGRAEEWNEEVPGWSLASQYIPWGDEGFYPSVFARHSQARDVFTSYELWIGAAGE